MIHRPIDSDELLERIAAVRPTWLARAKEETRTNATAGRCVSEKTFWSEIKSIFVNHQRRKCAYCERRLGEDGRDWDLEHFRPKKRVDSWPSPSGAIPYRDDAAEHGYFLLAFEPRNYLVACKPCNETHKKNFFPIAGERVLNSTDPHDLRTERPYLLHPLDELEVAPEDLIGFYGITPRTLAKDPETQCRATVTIEVLGLNRPELDLDRSDAIMHMWNALELQDAQKQATRVQARAAIEAMTGDGSPFANCARSFQRLYERDPAAAAELGEAATNVVRSHSL